MSRIVGIDLGTSTSEIAYINEECKPELIPNHLGEFITPSVIHIKENGEVIIGLPAKEMLLLDPHNTFMEIKRLMGTNTLLTSRNKSYTPVQLSSFILKYLIDCAATHLNEKIDRAVITVPAYFTDAQRKETIEAGEMAGIKVERIINEPTAASLDYGVTNMNKDQNIMVYDFGGGTLDVTVMEMFQGVIEVKSSCGNNVLGGKDIDQEIEDYIINKVNLQHNIDVTSDLRSQVRIKKMAEECKIALSVEESFEIDLPFLFSKAGQAINFTETITKQQFEEMIINKVRSSGTQVLSAIEDAMLTVGEIDLLLLVGGTTKIPLVSNFLANELNLAPRSLIDPDLGVVRGAAIQAGIINGDFKNEDDEIIITDVCPYSLSTEVLDPMGHNTYCDILINRNTTIPTTVQKVYETAHDEQNEVDISVYQGESLNPDENVFLNEFTLSNIPKSKAGKEKIKIKFSYDLNGILSVRGEVISTGKSVQIEINTYAKKENEVEELWKSNKNAIKYKSIIKKAEQILNNPKYDPLVKKQLATSLNRLKDGLAKDKSTTILQELKDSVATIVLASDFFE